MGQTFSRWLVVLCISGPIVVLAQSFWKKDGAEFPVKGGSKVYEAATADRMPDGVLEPRGAKVGNAFTSQRVQHCLEMREMTVECRALLASRVREPASWSDQYRMPSGPQFEPVMGSPSSGCATKQDIAQLMAEVKASMLQQPPTKWGTGPDPRLISGDTREPGTSIYPDSKPHRLPRQLLRYDELVQSLDKKDPPPESKPVTPKPVSKPDKP